MQIDLGHQPVTPFQSDRLWSRTYVALLISQFLAAFNDQAIHASAMFFAINTNTLSESEAISLMPILFYAPWGLFVTLAGYFADRFSKRHSLVFWKFAEVAITGLALIGFWLGTQPGTQQLGSWIVLSTVFLMGTHSAFFVPAKYGVMPEILQPHLLSKGNGVLESLSFLAVILGTMSGGVMSFLFYGQETMIGLILVGLALLGALISLLIRTMPAANPTLKFPSWIYGPLRQNLRIMFSSRPLVFAVIGIAFFTFVVAFMRAAVYMLGESQNPRWNELKTSAVVGTVALGIGLGAPLAGWVSGRKIELGLIPLGAAGMMLGSAVAALFLQSLPLLILCIILIGFATGFYLVPLFTLLQYRAPKTSKGDMIAVSNFVDISGAITASILFFIIVQLTRQIGYVPTVQPTDDYARGIIARIETFMGRAVYVEIDEDGRRQSFGRLPEASDRDLLKSIFGSAKPGQNPSVLEMERGLGVGDSVTISRYFVGEVEHLDFRTTGSPIVTKYDQRNLPTILFLAGGAMNFGMLLILWYLLPDLHRRGAWVLRSFFARRVHLNGLPNLPGIGGLILVTNAQEQENRRFIISAVDRSIRFFVAEASHLPQMLQWLRQGNIVGFSDSKQVPELIELIRESDPTPVIPVYCGAVDQRMEIAFGEVTTSTVTDESLRASIEASRLL